MVSNASYYYETRALGRSHPDLQLPWVQKFLDESEVEIVEETDQKWRESGMVSNSMMNETVSGPRAVRARVMFKRVCHEPDSFDKTEYGYIMSVGDGVCAKAGRGHGGFSSLILDHIASHAARFSNPFHVPCITVNISVNYVAAVETPCVFRARAWATEVVGRKIWVKAVLENDKGEPYATCKALILNPKPTAKAVHL
ncbi:hypothetical protein CERZMDRAFT_101675 [Cercospora zeae-maydis SCOH1-5]|uniref:Thioesterase domain-containing protein n=1 Tax=Cercospora zeae-maydis SCOH1-5 TaxID=717836 RepID=A0A6A6F3B4_9PEZI|nr:hypothetical protein CERZMDRAFT_101675 [Cercospora zeae-maydis SCOH1-5]